MCEECKIEGDFPEYEAVDENGLTFLNLCKECCEYLIVEEDITLYYKDGKLVKPENYYTD